METIDTVVGFFNTLCPLTLAAPQDPVGLQMRGRREKVHTVFGALEIVPPLWDKIETCNADFLYLHHPPLWKPFSRLDSNDPWCTLILDLYQRGISVLAHHTNLDAVEGGLADEWLKSMGFSESPSPLRPVYPESTYKVITYSPLEHLEKIMDAAFSAGGGKIGQYVHCSFSVEGTGTFTPLEGSNPYVGEHGVMERSREIRLEITVTGSSLTAVLEAIHKIHPYEEPVIDMYGLAYTGKPKTGLGRVIHTAIPLTPKELADRARSFIPTAGKPIAPYHPAPAPDNMLHRLAFCPGSGGSFLQEVVQLQADAFLTGDLSHHQIEFLRLQGITVIPVPHSDGERRAMEKVFQRFRRVADERGLEVEMIFEDEV